MHPFLICSQRKLKICIQIRRIWCLNERSTVHIVKVRNGLAEYSFRLFWNANDAECCGCYAAPHNHLHKLNIALCAKKFSWSFLVKMSKHIPTRTTILAKQPIKWVSCSFLALRDYYMNMVQTISANWQHTKQ